MKTLLVSQLVAGTRGEAERRGRSAGTWPCSLDDIEVACVYFLGQLTCFIMYFCKSKNVCVCVFVCARARTCVDFFFFFLHA